MTIEIKTATIEPVRNTFSHIERRFGDKPATRYQEATYDLQSESFFHYKPLWQPDKELNDPSRTDIKMEDWYLLKDPRQFYYGSYVQQRAKMQEVAESNYAFFDKRKLAERLTESQREELNRFVVPLRHLEQTANLNNMFASAYGYGTAITQACMFHGMDRLGIAQYLSRIGLILDGNTGSALARAKKYWIEDPVWQGMRKLAEETTVIEDWFEVFVAQNLVMDSLVYPLMFHSWDEKMADQGNADVGMLLEFMQQWFKDGTRWVDSVIKTVAAESDENKALLEKWVKDYRERTESALAPLVESALDADAMASATAQLDKRLQKCGLAV